MKYTIVILMALSFFQLSAEASEVSVKEVERHLEIDNSESIMMEKSIAWRKRFRRRAPASGSNRVGNSNKGSGSYSKGQRNPYIKAKARYNRAVRNRAK